MLFETSTCVAQITARCLSRSISSDCLIARVDERTRIARELHDTLLQSFQAVLLLVYTVSEQLPPGKAKQTLEGVVEQAQQGIT